MPQLSNTFGSTIPQPNISIHPEYLQILQPLPLHKLHETSISADGSVKGLDVLPLQCPTRCGYQCSETFFIEMVLRM